MNANILATALFELRTVTCKYNEFDPSSMRDALRSVESLIKTYTDVAWEADGFTYLLTYRHPQGEAEIGFATMREVNAFLRVPSFTAIRLEKISAKGDITLVKEY